MIVSIGKGKGDWQDCMSFRGITLCAGSNSLLSAADKNSILSPIVSETIVLILALRVHVKLRYGFQQGLLAPHIDLKKAWFSASLEFLEFFADSCKDYWTDDRPLLWDWEHWKCGAGNSTFFLVNSGVCPCSLHYSTFAWIGYLLKLFFKVFLGHQLATSK